MCSKGYSSYSLCRFACLSSRDLLLQTGNIRNIHMWLSINSWPRSLQFHCQGVVTTIGRVLPFVTVIKIKSNDHNGSPGENQTIKVTCSCPINDQGPGLHKPHPSTSTASTVVVFSYGLVSYILDQTRSRGWEGYYGQVKGRWQGLILFTACIRKLLYTIEFCKSLSLLVMFRWISASLSWHKPSCRCQRCIHSFWWSIAPLWLFLKQFYSQT